MNIGVAFVTELRATRAMETLACLTTTVAEVERDDSKLRSCSPCSPASSGARLPRGPPWPLPLVREVLVLTFLGLMAVAALIAANGYFVAAEFAFVAARRGRLDDAAATGDRRSGRAVQVHKRLSFMLSGAQLGITVTSLAVGYIAEPTLGRALEPVMGAIGLPEPSRFGVALTVGFVLATAAQMVFGELAPKNLAIARPEPVARALAGSTLVFMRLASPLIRLFDGSASRLLRAVGIEPVEELHGGVSVEELDLIVEESAERGKLSARQGGAARAGDRLRWAARIGGDGAVEPGGDHPGGCDVRGAPAPGGDRALALPGHRRRRPGRRGGPRQGSLRCRRQRAGDDAGRGAGPAGPRGARDSTAPVGARRVAPRGDGDGGGRRRVRCARRGGHPGGPGRGAGRRHRRRVRRRRAERRKRNEDGSWAVPGSWRIDEVERVTGVVLPTDAAYETLAGLVLTRRQRIPAVGDRVEVRGAVLEVTAMDGCAVTRVRVIPPGPDPADTGPTSDAAGGPDESGGRETGQ